MLQMPKSNSLKGHFSILFWISLTFVSLLVPFFAPISLISDTISSFYWVTIIFKFYFNEHRICFKSLMYYYIYFIKLKYINNYFYCLIILLLLNIYLHIHTYTLTGHFIRYILLVPGWTPFCLQNCLNSSWHRFNKVLETFLRDFGPYWHDSITQLLQIYRLHIHDANLHHIT